MNRKNVLAMAAAIVLGAMGQVHAATVSIDTSTHSLEPPADNQGWWSNTTVNNNHTNDNYFTGFSVGSELRSFFSFDLGGLSGTVTSATFEVRRYDQPANVTLGLFDVSTPAATLLGTRQGLQDAGIFADLGGGKSYGNFIVPVGNADDVLTLFLNAAAVADIQATLGHGFFSIGAAIQGGDGSIFAGSGGEPGNNGPGYTQRLTLNIAPVPVPGALLMLAPALAGLGVVSRRKASA